MTLSFADFRKLCEDYDPEVQGRSQITGVRPRPDKRKTPAEKTRVKAIGGGKTAPAKDYKPRKDRGVQGAGRGTSTKREQQPTQERGTAGLSPKEQQRKAYKERKARERGEKSKTADQLLSKKDKPKVDPNYKPAKASGLTRQERMKLHRKGETELRRTFKKQETDKYEKETGQKPDKKGRTTIGARVSKRMST